MRKCTKCSAELTPENTTLAVFRSRNNYCRVCWSLRDKEHRKKDYKASTLRRIKGNAKIRNLPCSLTVADIPAIPKHCPVFPWIKLSYAVGVKRHDGSPSLDRIDNDLGYVKGNVRWVSDRANILKSNASDEELIMLGNDARKRNKIENKA